MSTIRLPLRDAELLLVVAKDWCRVQLRHEGQLLELGAESIGVVAQRLLTNMQPTDRKPAGEVDGQPAWWVLSLAERHSTFYYRLEGSVRRLLIQGANGEWLWRGELPDTDWQVWLTELEARLTRR
jgi:hypothetical protein